MFEWPGLPLKFFDTCPDGYWADIDECKCKPCHASCFTCRGPEEFDCMICANTMLKSWSYGHSQNTPCQPCQEGFFQQPPNTGTCVACHSNCKSCYGPGPSDCKICSQEGMVANIYGECVENCKHFVGLVFDSSGQNPRPVADGYTSDSTGFSGCKPCSKGCLNCARATSILLDRCEQCEVGFKFTSGSTLTRKCIEEEKLNSTCPPG